MEANIPQETLDWLKEQGAHKYENPMTWHLRCHSYSDEFLEKTPLAVIKAFNEKELKESDHVVFHCHG